MEGQKAELKMIRMSEVESQEVKWLWYPFIPYGKLTIIQGDPGDGKTTLVLNIAAKLSKLDAMVMRELYTKYKAAPTEEEKEKARKEYLDRRGVPESFRW